ncbi:hypothetical protein Y1Q_0020056 [Alligator mississippiensis]|uniref:Guanylate-binding protein N-terminal domain-containing protein n=1 Tax=Alligator mississippiensis TaxID=8496 RepID=A0A151LYY1_ALLMI|nr:hypothetical protein Y1Q_0020056 [Alligator mississippiensis]
MAESHITARFPDFVWILKDVELDLQTGHREGTEVKYLEHVLKTKPGAKRPRWKQMILDQVFTKLYTLSMEEKMESLAGKLTVLGC